MSYYREQLEQYLSKLDVKADTILDVGGEQNPVKGRTKEWDVENYHVLDKPQYDLDSELGWDEWQDTADVVFCLEVFEYLINPYQAFQNIEKVMKVGASAIISFPLIYPHHNELELDSLRYTEFGIKRLANETGLEVTDITYRVDRSNLLQRFYAQDGMKAAKQYDHHNATGFIVRFTK